MIKELLEQGLDLNEAVTPGSGRLNETAWQCFLEHAHEREHFFDIWDVAKLMLQHGADRDVRVKVAKIHSGTDYIWVDARTCLTKRFDDFVRRQDFHSQKTCCLVNRDVGRFIHCCRSIENARVSFSLRYPPEDGSSG